MTCYEVADENQLHTWIKRNTERMIGSIKSKPGIQQYMFRSPEEALK